MKKWFSQWFCRSLTGYIKSPKVWEALCPQWLSSICRYDFPRLTTVLMLVSLPTTLTAGTIPSYPAHKRHWFKLQPRQRERKERAWRITHIHTLRSRGRERNTQSESQIVGILQWLFFHLHEHNRRPPQDLKMWTEVGKLVLLHLLLMELHCAKGKPLVSARRWICIASRTATLWGSLPTEKRHVCQRSL